MDDITAAVQASLRAISLQKICSTAILFLICTVVVRLLLKLNRKLLFRTKLDERMQKLVLRLLKVLMYTITCIIVIGSLGIDMTSLVALLSVFSLGVTLAAEDVLANMAGGLVVLSAHPFAIGDYIEVSGAAGTVDEVTLNYTKLVTPDGHLVMLPNKTMADSRMINYTALGRRRVTQVVCAPYASTAETVKAACLRAAAATEYVLADPLPLAFISACKQSCIEYTVYCWTEASHFLAVKYALAEHLREAFTEASIDPPYDHLTVHIAENRE